jgi:hypothetical protein
LRCRQTPPYSRKAGLQQAPFCPSWAALTLKTKWQRQH